MTSPSRAEAAPPADPADAIATHVVEVAAVERVATRLRQLTLAGLPDLGTLAPDAFFLVIRPHPGTRRLLDLGAPMRAYRDLPAGRRPDWTHYTARRWRPSSGELDAWFVLHDCGPLARWAGRARCGERLALWGPRTSYTPPTAPDTQLLVGDETGLAALTRIAASATGATRVVVVVEADADVPLPAGPNVDAVRVDRRQGRPGADPALLRRAVARLDLDPRGLHAFGAGEHAAVTAVGTHLREEVGIPRERVRMLGYWRADGGE